MGKTRLLWTYKLKAAVTLATAIGVLEPKHIQREGVNAEQLYGQIAEQGYTWDTPNQVWRKRYHKNGKPVYPASETPIDNTRAHLRDEVIRITFHGPHDLVLRHTEDFRAAIDLIGGAIVLERPPYNFKALPDYLAWQITVEFYDEDGHKI